MADIEARLKSLRGMSVTQIKELQSKIGVNPDGHIGEGTLNAYRAYLGEQALAATRQAEQAKADAAKAAQQARAEAERASADTAKQKAEAEKATAEAEQARAAAERERTAQARQAEESRQAREKVDLAIKTGALGAGLVLGVGVSKMANKLANKSITSAAPALAALADETRKLVPKAKPGSVAMTRLAGVVHTFDAQKLSRIRGPAGLILGASIIAEGIGARYFASQDQGSETFQKIGNAVGAASVAAGVTVIGKDLYARASPIVRPNAAHVQALEGARRLISQGGQVPTPAKPGADLSKRGRGAVGPSVSELRTAAKEAGIRNASRMSKAEIMTALEAAKPAAAATASTAGKVLKFATGRVLPVVGLALAASAAVSSFSRSAEAGESGTAAVTKAGARFLDSLLTGGLVEMAVNKFAGGDKAEPAPAEPAPAPAKNDARSFIEAAREGVAPMLEAKEPWSGIGPDRQAEGMRAISEASNISGLFSAQPEHPEVTARGKYQQVVAQFARDAALRVPEVSPPPVIPQAPPQALTGGLTGFQLPHVREAALRARMSKQ